MTSSEVLHPLHGELRKIMAGTVQRQRADAQPRKTTRSYLELSSRRSRLRRADGTEH